MSVSKPKNPKKTQPRSSKVKHKPIMKKKNIDKATNTKKPKPAVKTKLKKILIVEDNPLNMKLFRDLLQAHKYETVETDNGKDVTKIVNAERPDLIIMDIQLPEISGLDIISLLKADEDLKSIPIIAVTAFAMKGDEKKIRETGCEDYLSKPISVLQFIETVHKHLDAKAVN